MPGRRIGRLWKFRQGKVIEWIRSNGSQSHANDKPVDVPQQIRTIAIMLGLELRKEFKGRRLKGTAIELTNKNKTGATQVPAPDFLKITNPTADVLKTIEAVGPNQGRPVMGEKP